MLYQTVGHSAVPQSRSTHSLKSDVLWIVVGLVQTLVPKFGLKAPEAAPMLKLCRSGFGECLHSRFPGNPLYVAWSCIIK